MKVIVKREARKRFRRIVLEGELLFGERVAKKLFENYSRSMELLSRHPYMGQREPLSSELSKEYRALLFHPHYKLIYRVEENTIYIVDVWDTRRDPHALVRDMRD